MACGIEQVQECEEGARRVQRWSCREQQHAPSEPRRRLGPFEGVAVFLVRACSPCRNAVSFIYHQQVELPVLPPGERAPALDQLDTRPGEVSRAASDIDLNTVQ